MMFSSILKPIRATLGIFAVSALLVSCGDDGITSSLPTMKSERQSIIDSAPARNTDVYLPGQEPENRTGDYAIKTDVCPTTEEVNDFINRYTSSGITLSVVAMQDDGILTYGPGGSGKIDHYSFETVIGTMNADCLPALDGATEYTPGMGGESLREEWYNFQGVYMTAYDQWETERDEAFEERMRMIVDGELPVDREERKNYDDPVDGVIESDLYQLIVDYNYSLQVLGIVSALSGGYFFKVYENNAVSVTNPDLSDGTDRSWSTHLVQYENRLPAVHSGFYEEGSKPRYPASA